MTQGFDEWYRDARDITAKAGWDAGQQSRQAEIDELQKNFNNSLKTIEIQQRFLDDADGANKFLTSQSDELQKRIDEALRFYNEAKLPHNIGMIQMAIYLKGTNQ